MLPSGSTTRISSPSPNGPAPTTSARSSSLSQKNFTGSLVFSTIAGAKRDGCAISSDTTPSDSLLSFVSRSINEPLSKSRSSADAENASGRLPHLGADSSHGLERAIDVGLVVRDAGAKAEILRGVGGHACDNIMLLAKAVDDLARGASGDVAAHEAGRKRLVHRGLHGDSLDVGEALLHAGRECEGSRGDLVPANIAM